MTSAAEVVTAALDALRVRDWEAFAQYLHPEVVHRTPGVPEPILGREAFVMLSRQAVARTPDVTFEVERLVTEGDTVVVIGEWTYTGPAGRVRQPSVSIVDVREGQIWRDLEYVGLAIQRRLPIVVHHPREEAVAQFNELMQALAAV